MFDTTDSKTGSVEFIPVAEDEAVEVVLLSESKTGEHQVVFRFNAAWYGNNGEWQIGTVSDAETLAAQLRTERE